MSKQDSEVFSQVDVLSKITEFLGRYLLCSEHQRTVLALWVLHTWCPSAAQVSPFLSIHSAYKQSGKSLCLQLLSLLCQDPALAVGLTASTLHQRMELKPPSALLLDDCQATLGTRDKAKAPSLRALLASSFQRGFGYMGPKGDRSLFCPKAFAGRGELPEELADRALPIILGPWGAGAVLGFASQKGQILGTCAQADPGRRDDCVVRFPQSLADITYGDDGHPLPPPPPVQRFDLRQATREAQSIKKLLAAWAQLVPSYLEKVPRLGSTDFDPGLSLRRRDLCEPLVQLADAVGGEWPWRARRGLMMLFLEQDKFRFQPGLQLLQDLKECFTFHCHALRLSSFVLLEWLQGLGPRPWDIEGPMNARRLARMLAPLEVRPRLQRTGPPIGSPKLGPPSPTRGYLLQDFIDAWSKYLGHVPPPNIPGIDYPEPYDSGRAYDIPFPAQAAAMDRGEPQENTTVEVPGSPARGDFSRAGVEVPSAVSSPKSEIVNKDATCNTSAHADPAAECGEPQENTTVEVPGSPARGDFSRAGVEVPPAASSGQELHV